ncbi:MAG: flagellar biosynthesis anti-sigma factor FlgM [Deltaproteobacteria bacterium]|nr:flagellar biosynthesis anti-sigma factor FlgM [Deltaproteobacteria bacterium]
MKIRERYTQGIANTRGVSPREKTSEAAPASRSAGTSDTVQISARSMEIQKARQVAIQAPDIRQELVGAISDQIDRGEYSVTGADVAPKLIREHLMDAR